MEVPLKKKKKKPTRKYLERHHWLEDPQDNPLGVTLEEMTWISNSKRDLNQNNDISNPDVRDELFQATKDSVY